MADVIENCVNQSQPPTPRQEHFDIYSKSLEEKVFKIPLFTGHPDWKCKLFVTPKLYFTNLFKFLDNHEKNFSQYAKS